MMNQCIDSRSLSFFSPGTETNAATTTCSTHDRGIAGLFSPASAWLCAGANRIGRGRRFGTFRLLTDVELSNRRSALMERELIAWLREHLPPHPLLRLGLGDDAAVLRMAGVEECVLTVDLLTDQVDFELSQVDPRRVGRKALAANLSDLAAMAAKPLAGVVALALPRGQVADGLHDTGQANGSVPLLRRSSAERDLPPGTACKQAVAHGSEQFGLNLAVALYEGMLPLAEKYDLAIAGGDTNSWDGPLAISITLLGAVTPRGPLRRNGVKPGDRIVVTGSFGGSLLGRHLDFEPRINEALYLHDHYELHAGIDVSDGLSLDLAHLLEESRCGAVVDTDAVPVADDARRLADRRADSSTPLDHALADGEDFELILAVPADEARRMLSEQPLSVPLTEIGEFIAEPGLWQIDRRGLRRPLVPQGWQHT
jgi:thiamine-monophosphate kinase